MPITRRLASRQTAKASGSSLSSDSPAAIRSRNCGVLAWSSASESFSSSGSKALILTTIRLSWRNRRSLRLPKTRVSRLLIIEGTGWKKVPGGDGLQTNQHHKRNRAQCALLLARTHCNWGRARDLQATGSAAAHRGIAAGTEELARIDRHPVLPHLEMHMGTGRTPGRTGLGDLLPGPDQVALAHAQARVVRISGDIAIAVVDIDHIAVGTVDTGELDHTVSHRQHRVTDPGAEIQALVVASATTERVIARAEARGDVAVVDRQAGRQRIALQLLVEQQRFEHAQL